MRRFREWLIRALGGIVKGDVAFAQWYSLDTRQDPGAPTLRHVKRTCPCCGKVQSHLVYNDLVSTTVPLYDDLDNGPHLTEPIYFGAFAFGTDHAIPSYPRNLQ